MLPLRCDSITVFFSGKGRRYKVISMQIHPRFWIWLILHFLFLTSCIRHEIFWDVVFRLFWPHMLFFSSTELTLFQKLLDIFLEAGVWGTRVEGMGCFILSLCYLMGPGHMYYRWGLDNSLRFLGYSNWSLPHARRGSRILQQSPPLLKPRTSF